MSNSKRKKERSPSLKRLLNVIPFQDDRLSYKARGILAYLFSKPKGWKGQIYNICSNSKKDGITTVRSGVRELEEFGYANLKSYPKRDGKFQGKYYEFYDIPLDHQTEAFEPNIVKTDKDLKTIYGNIEPWMDGLRKVDLN
jgi:hypothetical protein